MKELHELLERTARMEQSLSDLNQKFDDQKPIVSAVHEHSVEIAKIKTERKMERSIIGAAFAAIIAWFEHGR